MFEDLKKEIGNTEISARIKFRNGKIIYGVIANLLPEKSVMKRIWFFPNQQLNDLQLNEGILMNEENVEDIDLYLK